MDCNILDRNEKYQYKEQYEQFKLIVNLLGGVLAIASYFFNFMVLDKLGMFLIVWYYCTLTIRLDESSLHKDYSGVPFQGIDPDCEWVENQGLVEVPPLRLCGGRGHPAGLAWRIRIFVRVVFFTGLEMTPLYSSGLIVGSMWRSTFTLLCYSCYSFNIRKAACTGFLILSILLNMQMTLLTIALTGY